MSENPPVRPASPNDVLAYVMATAALLNLPLDEARAVRVAGHLALSAQLARLLGAYPLDETDEPAELYCPAPFRSAGGGATWP